MLCDLCLQVIDAAYGETKARDEYLIRSSTEIESIFTRTHSPSLECTCCDTRKEIGSKINALARNFVKLELNMAAISQPGQLTESPSSKYNLPLKDDWHRKPIHSKAT